MNKHFTLGWDVGGAHLKAVLTDDAGRALQVFQQACPIWRGLDYLEQAVTAVMSAVGGIAVRHAVTMSGELADIFSSRAQGVARLAQCLADFCHDPGIHIYAGRRGFIPAGTVAQHWADVASANWHASAAYLAGRVGQGLLLDIGSTTADVILLHAGKPCARGYSDAERMRFDELIYTGVVRTPVMAVAQKATFEGEWQQLAAEHFATMADVYRLTGELPEPYDMADTADGAGKSLQDSARRLARMVGRDLVDGTQPQWRALAASIRTSQLHVLQLAVERVLSRGLLDAAAPLVGAGAGSFLVQEIARRQGREYLDAAQLVQAEPAVGTWAGVCLPAYAVAALYGKAAA